MKKRILIVAVVLVIVVCLAGTAMAAAPTPSPTASATASPPAAVGNMVIDGNYIGYGMNTTYSQGYTPSTAGEVASVVLPLTGPSTMTGNIYCTLNLGSAETAPFVISNYDSIMFTPEHPEQATNFFVAHFDIPLKANRVNGVYPLVASVRYQDGGAEVSQDFSVNVKITDGAAEATASAGTTSQPKVIMSNYTIEPDPVYAGQVFTVVATLKNTSKSSSVKNLTVNYKSQTTDLISEDGANTSYIDAIKADGTAQFSFKMEARADAKAGPQKIDIALAYEDAKATAYTATDEINVQVRQKIRLEYDEPKFPASAYMGDSLSTTLNLYNKGKNTLYNVTVSLDVPGLIPDSSAFLGNMESGASKSADLYATIQAGDAAAMGGAEDGTAVAGGISPGPVEGNFIVTYEDEYGDQYEMKVPVKTEIMEMPNYDATADPGMDVPEETSAGFPWWDWVIIAGAAAAVVGVVLKKRKKAKREQELMEDMDDDDIS